MKIVRRSFSSWPKVYPDTGFQSFVFSSPLTSPHLPLTRHAGRGRAPSLPKARPALTWPPLPTFVTSLPQVPGRGSGGSVPADVAVGGGGGRPGTGMHGRGGRRLWRRRSSGACDRMGCAGVSRPAAPQVDVDRGRRGGSRRPSPPMPRLWMGVRWSRGCLPRTRPRCSGAAAADRQRLWKRRSEEVEAGRRARSPRRGRSRGGRARPAARQHGGSSEPRVARIAAGDVSGPKAWTWN